MQVSVNSHHTQWAVGQGFFRSGRVSAGNRIIEYVYDCGSLSAIARDREISEYAARGGSSIDVVYLSHFHADHVNGVPELVRRAGVQRFVIPLVSPAERLLVYAEAAITTTDPDSGSAAEWYRALIVNPESALRSVAEDAEVVTATPEQSLLVSDTRESLADDEIEVLWKPPGAGTSAAAELSAVGSAGVSRPLWVWAPYVLTPASSRQALFVAALAAELGQAVGTVEERLLDDAYVRELVNLHESELKRAYGKVSAGLNLTSLCLFSGPAPGQRDWSRHWRTRGGGVDRPEVAAWDVRPGWLGTGDAPLRRRALARELADHYREALDEVGTFALPHHGSEHSFHADLLAMFNGSMPTCVVGAGVGNNYGHPHAGVVQAVADCGSHLVVVTGSESSRWTSSATSHL